MPQKAMELSNPPPLRLSTRLKTPSIRKRPQPTQSTSQASKKSRKSYVSHKKRAPAVPEPLALPLVSATLGDVVDLSTDEDEELGDNDDIDEEEQPESLKFMSTWRAVAGKESLPGVRTNIYKAGDITMSQLYAWKLDVLTQLLPRRFDTVRFEAVASYEKCRTADECPQQINGDSDLDLVMKVLKMWHMKWPCKALAVKIILYFVERKEEEQAPNSNGQQSGQMGGRRSATQQQQALLPHVLSTEQAAGNEMQSIADKWSCTNRSCRNYGYTCWQDRLPGSPDLATNHYPVPGELMRLWGKEISNQRATVNEPSTHLVCRLNAWRHRERKQPERNPTSSIQSGGSSTTNQLIQALLLRELTQYSHQRLQHQSQTSMLKSSPLRTSKDPRVVLTKFFNFLRTQPSWKSNQQTELLQAIESRILEDGWGIDQLKRIKKADWVGYGFGVGTLERIKHEVSFFKRQRPRDSRSNNI